MNNRISKKQGLFIGFAALLFAVIFTLAGCGSAESGPAGNGDPQTVTYSGTSGSGAYTLTITEKTSKAAYTPKNGDEYILVYASGGTSKTSAGTVTVSGGSLTLTAANGTGNLTVTVSGNSITSLTGTITWNDNTSYSGPGALTPGIPGTPGAEGNSPGSGWTWTKVTANSLWAAKDDENEIKNVIYANGKFIAVGDAWDNDDQSPIFYSTDGTNWAKAAGNYSMWGGFNDVAWGNNTYVAVGHANLQGLTQNCEGAATSSDGINWTTHTGAYPNGPFGGIVWMTGIVFTGSRFVAVGYTTDLYMSAAGGLIYHSTDGVRWTRINATGFSQTTMYGLTIDAEINDVAYGNGKLIAVANFGQMAQSTDNGATWRAISSNIFGTGESGDNILSIATNGSGTWVAGAEGGYIYYSTDNGATWQKKNSGSYNSKTAFNSGVSFVTWSNGKFVAANNSAQIGYSTDGVNWTLSYPNPLLESVTKQGKINCAAYGAGKWVAWGLQHDDVPALIYTTGD